MKAERYLRVDKREFLLQVVVIRLVKLLRELFVLAFMFWSGSGSEHSPSRGLAVLKGDL